MNAAIMRAVRAFEGAGERVELTEIDGNVYALCTHPMEWDDWRTGRRRVGTHYEAHEIDRETGRTKAMPDRVVRQVIAALRG